MWSTIDRARRRLDRTVTGTLPPTPGRDDEPVPETAPKPEAAPIARELEDIVIVFGPAELDKLRVALQHALGSAVERPDTPARIERALSLLLAQRGAVGRTPGPAPARLGLDAGVVGDPRRRRRARRRPRFGSPGGPDGSRHDRDRLSPVRNTLGQRRAARSAAAAACRSVSHHARPPSPRPARSATGRCPTTAAPEPRATREPGRPRAPPGRARPAPCRQRRLAGVAPCRRPDPDRPLVRVVRDRPALPGDRPGRGRPEPGARPRRDRHRDDPAQPLGSGRRHRRGHPRLEGGARGGDELMERYARGRSRA